MIDVSICIVNWNAEALLHDCLRSIYGHSGESSFEVIVVDNASNDTSAAMVSRDFPQVRLLVNDTNVGFAQANNQAFQITEGRYLLLLNNDTLVLPGMLDTMVQFMDTQSSAGIAGCKNLNPDGSLQPSCRSFPSLPIMFFRALSLDRLWPDNRWTGANYMSYWDHATIREVDVVKGSCMLVRREILQEVGPLDPSFFFYFEEIDWCHRARQKGWKTYFVPDAVVIHYGGQSSGQQSGRMRVAYYQSLLRYFQKHHGQPTDLVVRMCAILEISLRMAYWSAGILRRPPQKDIAINKCAVYWPALRWLITGNRDAP